MPSYSRTMDCFHQSDVRHAGCAMSHERETLTTALDKELIKGKMQAWEAACGDHRTTFDHLGRQVVTIAWLLIVFDPKRMDINNPHLSNIGLRVAGQFFLTIIHQRRIRHFNHEDDILSNGMRLCIKIGAIAVRDTHTVTFL